MEGYICNVTQRGTKGTKRSQLQSTTFVSPILRVFPSLYFAKLSFSEITTQRIAEPKLKFNPLFALLLRDCETSSASPDSADFLDSLVLTRLGCLSFCIGSVLGKIWFRHHWQRIPCQGLPYCHSFVQYLIDKL